MDYDQAGRTAAYHTMVNIARRTNASDTLVFLRAYVAVLMAEMNKLNEELVTANPVPAPAKKFALIRGGLS